MSSNYGDGMSMRGSGINAIDATWFVTCEECGGRSIVDVTINEGTARWQCPRCEQDHEEDNG